MENLELEVSIPPNRERVKIFISHEQLESLVEKVKADKKLLEKIRRFNRANDELVSLGVQRSPGIPSYACDLMELINDAGEMERSAFIVDVFWLIQSYFQGDNT